MSAALPLGLHLTLVARDHTLRFVLWFERAAPPHTPRTFKAVERDVPFLHPFIAAPDEAPPWLPKGLEPARTIVRLDRLGTYLPLPVPGLVQAWDVATFRTASRTVGRSPYGVTGFVVPPELALHPLRAWIRGHLEAHGAAFVALSALAVLDVLDGLCARLAEGPLLPTIIPATNTPGSLAWVPPFSLADLHRLDASLRAARLDGADIGGLASHLYRDPPTWTDAREPVPTLHFVAELFDAAVTRANARPRSVSDRVLHEAVARGAVDALHADQGSCLGPAHPLRAMRDAPREHLEARLCPVPGAKGDATWDLTLGLVSPDGVFASVESLARGDVLRHSAAEHEGRVWFHAGSVLARDWTASVAPSRAFLAAPELLAGHTRLSESDALDVLQAPTVTGLSRAYAEWAHSIGYDAPRGKSQTMFSAKPDAGGSAKVRVRWELAGPSDAALPPLHAVRFVPALELALSDGTLTLDEAERALRVRNQRFLRVGAVVLPRADLEAAVELLRAREKVLLRLEASRGVPWSTAVELEDEWAAEAAAARMETVFAARWNAFLAGLRDGSGVPRKEPPKGFRGTLRPYQLRGLAWLSFITTNGFGGCLADDMGLGKTVQVLAMLALRREDAPKAPASLVVCPTAMVLGWAREAERFTPGLRVVVHQGGERAVDAETLAARVRDADLVVTSYALVRRDAEALGAVTWDIVIADEAQNLKNPDAQQTRVLRGLSSHARLCMTGTPVENRIRDLWSIFHVAIPGLLGGPTRFARTFGTAVRSGDARAMERLGGRIGPFLLRRTKADPGIAADLPPKQEQDEYCVLTREQAALYRAMTDATLDGLADTTGMTRRAHILGALTRFKQICDHPECFATDRPEQLAGRSGKFDRALDLVEELVDEGQRVLVFTQFVEMGRMLQRALGARLGAEIEFYHGGLTPAQREAVVDAFEDADGPPVLVLSLRAGGTGLTLTAASAVLHYDRWWNPAVEDQATDRAHRIGQTRKVNVYRMVTRDTVEERIAAMLVAKRGLAQKVLASAGEEWITELDDDALRRFLTLGTLAEEP